MPSETECTMDPRCTRQGGDSVSAAARTVHHGVHNLGACGAREHRAADKVFSRACQDPLMDMTILL